MSLFSPSKRSIRSSGRNGMRRQLTFAACLAFVASLTCVAKADPITGTITLTVAPSTTLEGLGSGIPIPVVYSSGPVDLSALGQTVTLTGLPMGLSGPGVGGVIAETINTTFDMKITFEGASGSQPTVDVTGPLSAGIDETPSPNPPSFISMANANPTSSTLQGWTSDSDIPLALINQYLITSNYHINIDALQGSALPDTQSIWLSVTPITGVNAPEPATVVIFLAAIAGLGVHRSVRHQRPTGNVR